MASFRDELGWGAGLVVKWKLRSIANLLKITSRLRCRPKIALPCDAIGSCARLLRARGIFCCVLAWRVISAETGAAERSVEPPAVDKSAFNLFNPTPVGQLREMTIDGTGATQSPYTVDVGHFQMEMMLFSYSYDRNSADGEQDRFKSLAIAPTALKVGLLNQLDAQLLLEPYNVLKEQAGTNELTRGGFGDTSVRLKYNLWGNDAGLTALAVMPYLKFGTSQEGIGSSGIEGGVILPMAVMLPWHFEMWLTSRFDAVRDASGSGSHAEFANGISLAYDLANKVVGYVQFSSVVSSEGGADWSGLFETGLIYSVTDNIQLNGGVNIGVTTAADDWTVFVGLAYRF
jgi:hypothetical protein